MSETDEYIRDTRPGSCRFRLQDEGRPYPRSSCTACGASITTGLGQQCALGKPKPDAALSTSKADNTDKTQVGTLWRHKKTGIFYTIFATCQIEATNEPGVLYHSIHGHGPLWCRPAAEFMDGRFSPVEIVEDKP